MEMINTKNAKELLGLRVFAFILLIVFISLSAIKLITLKIKYSKFVAVAAEITDISTVYGADGPGGTEIKYKFKFDGKVFTASIIVGSNKCSQQIGKFEKIRINPDDPAEIEDKRTVNGFTFISVFWGATLILLIFAIHTEKANRNAH